MSVFTLGMKSLSGLVLFTALAPTSYSQSVLHTFNGDPSDDGTFSASHGSGGDMNGDGFDDVIVGAWAADNNGTDSGSARVFSGVDGSVLYTFNGDSPGDRFGFSVGAGDVDGDGFDDLIVGAHLDDNNGPDSGSARVFSGDDGSVLYTFNGDSTEDFFGISVSGAGDLNGDGFDDVIVGARINDGMEPGSARVFSGADGSILHAFNGDSPGDGFGEPVKNAGDVNGDGFADVIVGAPRDDTNGRDSGKARVFSGCDRCNPIGTNYCTANPNSTGLPAAIAAFGSEVIANNDLTLVTTDVAPNQFGYYLMSEERDFVPFFGGSEGNLCLAPPIIRFNHPPTGNVLFSGQEGILTFSPDLTNLPFGVVFQPGETWYFQSWFRDVVGPNLTSNTSDGVGVTWQ